MIKTKHSQLSGCYHIGHCLDQTILSYCSIRSYHAYTNIFDELAISAPCISKHTGVEYPRKQLKKKALKICQAFSYIYLLYKSALAQRAVQIRVTNGTKGKKSMKLYVQALTVVYKCLHPPAF